MSFLSMDGQCMGSMKNGFVGLLLASIVVFTTTPVIADTFTVYGPRVFERHSGAPVVETDTFYSNQNAREYTLKIYNGGLNDGDYELVSSAVIYFNGQEILSPNELNQHVDYVEKQVVLASSNTIEVEVRGKPGGALVIGVEGFNDAPVANAQTVATNEDDDVSITLSASDADNDSLSYRLNTQTTQGTLSGYAPNLTYVPDANFNGNDHFEFVANDGLADSASAIVTINVLPVNDSPEVSNQSFEILEDNTTAILLAGTDIDGDTLTYNVVTQPSNGTLNGVPPSFTYIPNANFSGNDSFTYAVNDGLVDSAAAVASVTINAINDAPDASSQTVVTDEDTAVVVLLNGIDIENSSLTYTVVDQPTNGVLNGIAPNLSYIPNNNFNGTDSFSFIVNDGFVDSAVANVAITISASNDAPTAETVSATTDEDSAVSITLTGNDIDGDALTYSIVTQPENGSLSGVAPNLTYTPNSNFNGTDTFTFKANDGVMDSAVVNVAITISASNDAPIANAVSVTTNEDTAVPIVLTGNDIEGDALTYNLVTQPMNGSLSGVAPNLNYTPSVNFNGADSFTFSVNDGVLNSAVVTVSLLVIAVNDEPQIISEANLQATENTLYTYQVEAIDPNNPVALIYGMSDAPNGATINPITGLLQWTPSPEQSGHNTDDNPYCLATSESQLDQRFADVVLTVDISGSMGGETEWIQTLVPLLDAHLIQQNIGASTESNLYGLITFGGSVKNIEMDNQGALLASATQYYNATQSVSSNGGGIEDGWAAIDRSLQYPLRASSSKNIILISDEDRDNTNSQLTFSSLQSALQDSKAILNAVVNASFICGDARPALGLGQNGIGYVADGFGDFDLCENAMVNVAEGSSEQDYVDLALALGGAAWDLNALRSGGKDAQSFVKALMEIKVDEIEKQFDAVPQADVVVQRLAYANNEIAVEIKNRGLTDITSPITIDLFDGSDLVTSLTVNELLIGNSQTLSHSHTATNTISAAVTVQGLEECITNNNQLSALPFAVNVTDDGGLSDTQHYALTVDNQNQTPVITSTASSVAPVASVYQYQVVASDPDTGDDLQYQLTLAPQGMVIDQVTGLVTFKPTAGQLGAHDVSITVTDINGLSDTQTFALTVDNSYVPLRFTSEPPIRASQSQEYRYQAVIQSDVTAQVTFSLFLAPDGMTVNPQTGEVTWQVPDTAPSEEYPFVLQVADQFGNVDIQAYELIGDFVPLPPVLTVTNLGARTVGETFIHLLQYTDENYTQSEFPSFTLVNGPENASLVTEITTALRWGACGNKCGLFDFARGNLTWTTEVTSPGAPIISYASTGTNLACRLPGTDDTDFDVVRTYGESGLSGRPIAGPLYDSNQNAQLDDEDRRFLFAIDRNNYLRALDALTLKSVWQSSLRVSRNSRGTLIDLDGDASAELLFFDTSNHLLVFNSDGSLRWRSAVPAADGFVRTQAMPVDFDNDGVYEIAFGPSVFDANGNLLWQFPLADQNGPFAGYSIAHPIDFDLDGISEIAYFNQVRDAQGNVLWNIPTNSVSSSQNKVVHLAFANFDSDPEPELVVNEAFYTGGRYYRWLSLVDNDGSLIWETQVLGAGSLAIADVDNDGDLEIYSATSGALFDHNGNTVWQDGNRYSNGLLADIDGDGHLEIIDGNSAGIYILDAASGELIRLVKNRLSLSATDDIMYADIDNDNQGEIVITGSRNNFVIINSAHNNWADAASVYAYNQQSIGDINEQLRLSQARGNYFSQVSTVTPTGNPLMRSSIVDVGLADVVMNSVYVTYQGQTNGPDQWVVHASVANQGILDAENLLIELFTDGVNGANKFGELSLSSLAAGDIKRPNLIINSADVLGNEIFAAVSTSTPECNSNNNVASAVTFDVQVTDSDGLFDRAKFSAGGIASEYVEISSTPPTQATVGALYQYQINAQGFNDELSYEVTSQASGLTINVQTGLITWTPVFDQANRSYTTTVIVTDTILGTRGYQYFSLKVAASSQTNTAPIITSNAVTQGEVGQNYRYPVIASDAQNDNITFSLINPPAGMSINSLSGLISWTPGSASSYSITVRASDERSAFSEQTYSLIIADSLPPIVSSTPNSLARVNRPYTYQILASDPEAQALTYALVTAPTGTTLSSSGVLSWLPTQVTQESMSVRVSDGIRSVLQTWNVSVITDVDLDFNIAVSDALVDEGDTVTIDFFPFNVIEPYTITATVDGQAITVTNGQATITASGIGVHTIEASLTDPYDTLLASVNFRVRDPNDIAQPVVSISNIANLEVVAAPKQVIGSVNDDNLKDWMLFVREIGRPVDEYVVLATGTTNVTDQVLGTFDPSLLQNGQFGIVLQATDINDQISYTSAIVSVEGDLKVGNFSITFEDVNIPVAGLPIVVTRTYDTRQRHKDLDFGYGWSVGYQNMRIHESRPIGSGWSINKYPVGLLDNYCVEPNGDPIVSITLPDGRVEKFKAKANPHCQMIQPATDVAIEFEAIEGTTSTLTQSSYSSVRIVSGNLVDLFDQGNDVDPNLYQLTTVDGYVFNLNQGFTISNVTTPTGHSITYTNQGITHSGGKSVVFNRDALNRITAITLPDGNVVRYEYDAQGNLIKHFDVLNQSTEFTYDSSHALLDIIDANGVTVTRNEYDDTGRLIAQIDGEGNRIEFTHDINSRQEIIRNRRGFTQVFTYDDKGNVLTETNALGETITRSYDAAQNVLSETDALGNTNAWTYDNKRNKLTETNALGHITTNTYNTLGKLLTETDDDSNILITSTYKTTGDIEQSTNALGQVTDFAYDPLSQQVSGITDELGSIAQVAYGADYPVSTTDSNGVVTTLIHDDMGNKLTETTSRTLADGSSQSLTSSYVYDEKGRLIQSTDPQGNITRTEYNIFDKETATVDALGRRTEYDYDIRGNLTTTIYPEGTTELNDYDAENNLIRTVDRNGNESLKAYDAANRLTQTTYADGSTTRNEYDAAGRMTASINALGNRTEYSYDAAGHQTQVRDAQGNITQYAYDKHGNRTRMTDAKGQVFNDQYDLEDRLIKTTYPDGTFSSTEYDARGRKISETDQGGISTQYNYDGAGRLIKVNDVLGQQTRYSYDEQGNKLTQTDAAGRTTSWTYDELGRVLSRTLPMGQVESFSYDAVGNVLTRTDFNGQTTSYTYDINNRVTQISYGDGSTETFSYDNNGNRTSASNAQGTWLYEYDALNRLIAETKPTGEMLEYGYDVAGNKTQLKVSYQNATTRVENSSYDVLNRLETVTDNNQNVTGYGYDENGNRASVLNANGTSTLYAYDKLNRLTKVSHYNGTGGLINEFNYTLSASGQRTQISEGSGRISNYSYDALNRLTSESITDQINGNHTSEYTYDSVGNRLSETTNGITTSYSYDANDRISTQGNTSYSYDANGNTLSKTTAGITTSYSYNAKDKLVSYIDSSIASSYQYNIDGIRIARVENGQAVNYLVDQNRDYAQVITESTATNVIDYTYGDDLLSQSQQGQTFTYHYDGLGSTRLLTDELGNNTDSYDYEAFGETLNRTGTIENSYLYAGEQFDSGLDNYYLRARYYDQGVGRFTQMDDWAGNMAQPISLHKYLYAANDPILMIDPSGYSYNSSDTTAALKINGVLATAGGGGSFASYLPGVMFNSAARKGIASEAGKEVFGIIGEMILDKAINAYVEMLNDGLSGSAANKGTRAHTNLQRKFEKIEDRLRHFGIKILAEEFRVPGEDGGYNRVRGKGRPKGSLGLDITVYYNGKRVLAFDLKTGRSMSKKRRGRLKQYFDGVDIIEIMVGRKK